MIVVQQIRTADHQAADPLLEKLRIDFTHPEIPVLTRRNTPAIPYRFTSELVG